MKENKHGSKAGSVSAMPQFNQGHWEKKPGETPSGGTRYASEMGACEEYKKSVEGLSGYVKKHKAQH